MTDTVQHPQDGAVRSKRGRDGAMALSRSYALQHSKITSYGLSISTLL